MPKDLSKSLGASKLGRCSRLRPMLGISKKFIITLRPLEASRQSAINGIGNSILPMRIPIKRQLKINAEADQMIQTCRWSKEQRDDYAKRSRIYIECLGVPARNVALSQTKPAAAKKFLDKAQQDKLITSTSTGRGKFIRTRT